MKVILVIDIPKNCDECVVKCTGYTAKEYAEKGIKRPSWCPLKPVHALKSVGFDYIIYERQYLYENLEREYEFLKAAREFENVLY